MLLHLFQGIVSTQLFNFFVLAPFKSVQKAVREAALGDFNPTPWALMTGNCISWTVYLVLINKNLFVFFANVFGVLLSVWLNLCVTKLQYQDHHTTEMWRSFANFLWKGDEKQMNQSEEGRESLANLALNITMQ
jgi:hypothetical protein